MRSVSPTCPTASYSISNTLSQHVKKYPTVQSSVSTFQSYPIGQKSVDTFKAYYAQYLSPFLSNFAGPYSYVAPYVLKADDIADFGLKKVDNNFPIVTKDPSTIKSTILDYAYSPFRLANDGRTFLTDTYAEEYKKCGGDKGGPVISGSKAVVTTTLLLTSETLGWLSSILSEKKSQGQDFASEKYARVSHFVGEQSEYVNGKKDDAINYASETAEKARNLAYATAEDAKHEGEQLKKEVKAKASK